MTAEPAVRSQIDRFLGRVEAHLGEQTLDVFKVIFKRGVKAALINAEGAVQLRRDADFCD